METQPRDSETTLSLLRFSRACATFFSTGINITAAFNSLARELPAPLATVLPALLTRACALHSFGKAMADWGEVFPATYQTFTEIGEMAGALDETMRYLAERLEEDLQLIRLGSPLRFLYAERADNWQALSPQQQQVTLMHVSHALAMMLTAGVPTRAAVQTASTLLPVREARAVAEIADGDLGNGLAAPLNALEIFPQSFRHFVTVGECSGALHFTLYKAAQFYHDDLRYTSGLVTQGVASQDIAGQAGALAERLQHGPIPIEITDKEFAFYTDALHDMGVSDEEETPPSGRQRMIALTRRFLLYAWYRGATAIEIHYEDHLVSLQIDHAWQQTRRIPSWMYEMLSYRLREMAGLDTSHIVRPDAGEIALPIAGTTHTVLFAYRPRQNGGMLDIRFQR